MMEDFTRQFKDRLQAEGDYTPNDRVWQKVEAGLKEKSRHKLIPYWPLWMALLLGLLLGIGTSHLWVKLNQPTIISSSASQDVLSPIEDTAVMNKIVNTMIHDTIIQYVYIDREIVQKYNESQALISSLRSQIATLAASSSIDASIQEDYLSLHQAGSSASHIGFRPRSEEGQGMLSLPNTAGSALVSSIMGGGESIPDGLSTRDLKQLPFGGFGLLSAGRPRISIPYIYMDFHPTDTDDDGKTLISSLTPDYFRMGISGVPLGSAKFSENSGGTSEVSGGIFAEFLFSRHISLRTGLDYRSSKAKFDDEELAFSYATPTGVDPNSSFDELYIRNSYIEIPVSLKYRIWDHKLVSPYSSVGLLMSKNVTQEYIFEFLSGDEEIYYTEEVDGGKFVLGSMLLAIGSDFTLTNRLYAFSELSYRYNFKIDAAERDRVNGVGLRLGIAYEF